MSIFNSKMCFLFFSISYWANAVIIRHNSRISEHAGSKSEAHIRLFLNRESAKRVLNHACVLFGDRYRCGQEYRYSEAIFLEIKHPQEKRENASSGYPGHDRQSHANTLQIFTGTDSGIPCWPQPLRVQNWQKHPRCNRAVLHQPEQGETSI